MHDLFLQFKMKVRFDLIYKYNSGKVKFKNASFFLDHPNHEIQNYIHDG